MYLVTLSLMYSHENGFFGFSCFDELVLGLRKLSLEDKTVTEYQDQHYLLYMTCSPDHPQCRTAVTDLPHLPGIWHVSGGSQESFPYTTDEPNQRQSQMCCK